MKTAQTLLDWDLFCHYVLRTMESIKACSDEGESRTRLLRLQHW
jgi:hypothetical protein